MAPRYTWSVSNLCVVCTLRSLRGSEERVYNVSDSSSLHHTLQSRSSIPTTESTHTVHHLINIQSFSIGDNYSIDIHVLKPKVKYLIKVKVNIIISVLFIIHAL